MLSLLRNPGRALGLTTPASSWRKKQSSQYDAIQGFKPKFQQLGSMAQSQQQQFQPQSNLQGQKLIDFYNADPYAGGRNSLMFKQATQGIDEGFAKSDAALQRRALASGIDPSGALQNSQIKRLGMLGNINSQLALQAEMDRERRMQGAFGVSNSLAQQGQQDYRSALGSQLGIDQQLYGMAGDQAQQEEARRAANSAALGNFLGQAGSLYGGLSGMGALQGAGSLLKKKKKPVQYDEYGLPL